MRILLKKLAEKVTEKDLLRIAKKFGRVNSVTLVRDAETQKPTGLGYIEMASDEEGKAAIKGLRGLELKGSKITIKKSEGELVQKHASRRAEGLGLPGANRNFHRDRYGGFSSHMKGGGGTSRGR